MKPIHKVNIEDAFLSIKRFVWFMYNVPSSEILEKTYGKELHPAYRTEKLNVLMKNPMRFYCELDSVHQKELAHAILEKYN